MLRYYYFRYFLLFPVDLAVGLTKLLNFFRFINKYFYLCFSAVLLFSWPHLIPLGYQSKNRYIDFISNRYCLKKTLGAHGLYLPRPPESD